MAISVGDKLPEVTLLKMGEEGPEEISLGGLVKGRKVVIFGLPGAYTGTCSTAHVPSFVRNMEALKAKGIDEVICVAVNDPFVLKAWGIDTGAIQAGISILGDASSELTSALGMEFSAPSRGFIKRSKRYALMAHDGVVQVLHEEENPGMCDISGGESMVAAI